MIGPTQLGFVSKLILSPRVLNLSSYSHVESSKLFSLGSLVATRHRVHCLILIAAQSHRCSMKLDKAWEPSVEFSECVDCLHSSLY